MIRKAQRSYKYTRRAEHQGSCLQHAKLIDSIRKYSTLDGVRSPTNQLRTKQILAGGNTTWYGDRDLALVGDETIHTPLAIARQTIFVDLFLFVQKTYKSGI